MACDVARLRVLVLGGGGFIGHAAVAAAEAAGFSAVAAGRRAPLSSAASRALACDATDAAAVFEACRHADYAVDAVMGSPASIVAATRTLCAAAARAGLRRIVHVGSMTVHAEGGGRYREAKLACEAAVARFVEEGGDAVILRPGIVYGPGSEPWVGRIGRLLRDRRIGDLGDAGDGACELVTVGDVAAAIVAAMRTPEAAGLALDLGAAGVAGTWNDYLVRLGCALGTVPVRRVTARRLRAEAMLARPLQAAGLVARRTGLRPGLVPDAVTPSLRALWRGGPAASATGCARVLALTRTSEPDGIAASAAWLLANWARTAPARRRTRAPEAALPA